MPELTVKTTTNLARLFGSVVRRLANPALMARIGNVLTFRIKDRTARGIDAHGQAFEPYSEDWADERAKRGRQTGHVDLNFSGAMWAGLHEDHTEDTVELFFQGFEATKAHGLNYGVRKNAFWGEVPQREFFAFNEHDENAMLREIVRSLRHG